MAKLYIVRDRNRKRNWAFQLPTGEVITLYADRWVECAADLSEYVRAGFIVCRDTEAKPAAIDVVTHAAVEPAKPVAPKDTMSQFAAALSDAFAKPPKQVDGVVVAEPAPIVPQDAVVAVEEDEDAQVIAHDEAADDGSDAYAAMTRKALWALANERGLAAGLEYRSATKAQLVRILSGNTAE